MIDLGCHYNVNHFHGLLSSIICAVLQQMLVLGLRKELSKGDEGALYLAMILFLLYLKCS